MATTSEGRGKAGSGSPAAPDLVELWNRHRASATASEAVYLSLRDAITAGSIAPGEHLGEPAIAESLGTSRTPIREALLRLEADRLVRRTENRRLVVAEVGPEEILHVYAVRQVLNGLAARLAAQNASTTDIVRLRNLHHQVKWAVLDGATDAVSRLNFAFHDAVCEVARNPVLLDMLRHAHATHHRYPGTPFSDPDRARRSVEEHEDLLAAIEERDPARAEALAIQHTTRATEARIAMLDGTVEDMRRSGRGSEPGSKEGTV